MSNFPQHAHAMETERIFAGQVPIAIGESRENAATFPDHTPERTSEVAVQRGHSPLSDPFFRGWVGGLMQRGLAILESERAPRFWGAAAGVLVCLVILRAVWAFSTEQPATHWERRNQPQAQASDGSDLVAMDVVVQRRARTGAKGHWVLISGVVENRGDLPIAGAKVAATFGEGLKPVMSWAGRWLHPAAFSGAPSAAEFAMLKEAPLDVSMMPGQRLPFVLVAEDIPPDTPFQLHVAAAAPQELAR